MTGRASTTVVVVSFAPGAWLAPCLASVTDQADEVLLVDNGSVGGEASAIGADAGVRVHRRERNGGFVGGVNTALAHVGTDLVALLNDDATASPDWLRSAAAELVDPSVAAVSPKIVFSSRYAEVIPDEQPWRAPGDPRVLGRRLTQATVDSVDVLAGLVGGVHRLEHHEGDRWRWTNGVDPVYVPLPEGSEHHDIVFEGQAVTTGWTGDVINNAGLYLSQLGHGGDHGLETADSGAFDHRAERFGVTGAAMVARKDTFDRVGRLAPSFFAYYEDLDWCWRARLGGYRFTYQPAATVRHHRSATTAQVGAEAMSHLARRNRLLCLVHNAPLPLAVEEIRRDTSQGPDAALRRSLARHLPAALAARVRHPPRGRGRRAGIYRAWAGRDETWGLPSQDAAFRRRMQEAAEQGR